MVPSGSRCRAGLYVKTVHGQEEMEADGLTLDEVEHVLLTAEIVERQKTKEQARPSACWRRARPSQQKTSVVAKIGFSGKLVILTVYLSTSEDEA